VVVVAADESIMGLSNDGSSVSVKRDRVRVSALHGYRSRSKAAISCIWFHHNLKRSLRKISVIL
jgi:hypothetical protein